MSGEATAWREGTTGFSRFPYPSSPTEMSSPGSRATSPALFPLRFGSASQPDGQQASQRAKGGMNSDLFFNSKNGRASGPIKSKDKGKEPLRGDSVSLDDSLTSESVDGGPSVSHYHTPSPFTSYDRSRPTESSIHGVRRTRGSLLIAASDALGFKFGRRRPSIRQMPMPIILPDVIEICAPRPDEEVEERNRLRDMAAQAIGLGPFMTQPETQSHDGSTEEDEGSGELPTPKFDNPEVRRLGDVRNSESTPNIGRRSPHGSSLSVAVPSALPPGRYRSGSMLAHTRTNSVTMAPIPSFPTKPSSLTPFQQSTAVLPKYYPPSSLRIFALSKSWKSRFLILSSPTALLTRGHTPAVSYLHLFKSSNTEERELERLEINEDSVVFVAEDEVGGRRNVIKIGGVDVGALKKEWNHEEGGRTMWLLQITDQAEAQKWISTIKNAILGQRTVRAGLLPGTTFGGIEPRGDMDVMLSIRAQGLVTSPSTSPRPGPDSPPPTMSRGDHYASSISSRSVRSQSTVPKPVPPGAVSTLKGLFTTSVRPRSGSRAASIDSERQQVDREVNDDSFSRMGSSLLNIIRSNTPDTRPATPPTNGANRHTLPFAPSAPIGRPIDRKILSERQPHQWVTKDPPVAPKDRANRTMSLGALSLQPPPRKRWTSMGPTIITTTHEEPSEKTPVNGNGGLSNTFGHGSSFGRSSYERPSYEKAETEPPGSPTDLSGFSFGTPEQRPRAPSLQSVSTYASGENALSGERSSSSTKRSSSGKRWSRQGLPHRLTPPSGPPPAIPPTQSVTRLHVHPYAAERPPSQTSSSHSINSQMSVVSSLPSFSKRASGSSVRSVNTSSTTQSHSSYQNTSAPRPLSSHRTSMPPPPRPAPTTALPPAPDQDSLNPSESAPVSSKSPFRSSVAHRTFRLSMIAPKPPPSSVLPPRPDEPDFKTHHRSSSGGNTRSTQLDSIPASPIPPPLSESPFPPPVGPLPPTPANAPSEILPRPTSRHSSFKRRLRILSAPSPSATTASTQTSRPTTASTVSPMFTTSPPATPIAEKITLFQNDPSFLQMHTPVLPSLPPPRVFIPPSEQYAELISLSPPPRRGSKQVLEIGLESPELLCTPDEKTEGEPRMLSLSRPGSVISLGIVSM